MPMWNSMENYACGDVGALREKNARLGSVLVGVGSVRGSQNDFSGGGID